MYLLAGAEGFDWHQLWLLCDSDPIELSGRNFGTAEKRTDLLDLIPRDLGRGRNEDAAAALGVRQNQLVART